MDWFKNGDQLINEDHYHSRRTNVTSLKPKWRETACGLGARIPERIGHVEAFLDCPQAPQTAYFSFPGHCRLNLGSGPWYRRWYHLILTMVSPDTIADTNIDGII